MDIKNRHSIAAFTIAITLWAIPQASLSLAEDLANNTMSPTWNQWRGPDRDGVWQGGLPASLADLNLVWERELQPSYSGPVTDGTRLFTTETVDKKYERVTAFDLESGETLWTTQWEGAMQVPFFAAANGSWIKSTPALGPNALVVLGVRDQLVCLNPSDGQTKWTVDLAERFGSQRPKFGAVCSPLIDNDPDEGDVVYIQGGGATLKLSLDDGSTIWRSLEAEDDDDAFSSPIIATLAGEKQLVVQTRTRLCGVSTQDGSLLWAHPIQAYRNMNILTPTIIGEKVFTAAHSGQSQMFDISRSDDGQWTVAETWSQKIQAYMSSPVVHDRTIYLHSKNQRLTAMDVDTGEILWTGKPMGKYQSMVHGEGNALVLDEEGELLRVKLDRQELMIQERLKVADDSWAYLGIIQDGVVVRDLTSLKVYQTK